MPCTWKKKKDRSQKRYAAVNDSSSGAKELLIYQFLEDILDPRDSNLTSDIGSAN
jgi:hypothetical protein